jgi:hypothetical protein
MIRFVKDVNLGKEHDGCDCIIKAGMEATFYHSCTITNIAGTLICPPRIGFHMFTHPEWRETLHLPLGACAIYDLDDRFPKDSYVIVKE